MKGLPTDETLGWVTIRGGQRILSHWTFGGVWLRQDGGSVVGWTDEDVTEFTPAEAYPVGELSRAITSERERLVECLRAQITSGMTINERAVMRLAMSIVRRDPPRYWQATSKPLESDPLAVERGDAT